MILYISVLFVVISPFSFLIWFFSLCFLMSLANGLSIYLSFQRTSFWLCWFLLWSLLFLLHFISALIFKISFLLLILGFFISSFSICFRCRVRLFLWLFSCFLRYACIAMSLPPLLFLIRQVWASQVVLVVKNPSANAGDVRVMGSIPECERPAGEEHRKPLQDSFLESPMNRGGLWAT